MPDIANAAGEPTRPDINILFKSNGDMAAALAYFADLPANGYNIIQLNDTYASHLATNAGADMGLVPISVAQITFSQVYIRTDDARFNSLESFIDYARDPTKPALNIANFETSDGSVGLEDFLIDGFQTANGLLVKDQEEANTPDNVALQTQGYENGSERYFSLFTQVDPIRPQSDALIEQPGDIARLIEAKLLKPIYTLLPTVAVTDDLRTRLGDTASFPAPDGTTCPAFFRYRGFFVSEDVPETHRDYLAWLFRSAFNTASFQDFNEDQYMDVLYDNDGINAAYCSADAVEEVFTQSVENYRTCYGLLSTN